MLEAGEDGYEKKAEMSGVSWLARGCNTNSFCDQEQVYIDKFMHFYMLNHLNSSQLHHETQ